MIWLRGTVVPLPLHVGTWRGRGRERNSKTFYRAGQTSVAREITLIKSGDILQIQVIQKRGVEIEVDCTGDIRRGGHLSSLDSVP